MKLKDYIRVALFSVLITICSWISIPSPVPFSLQTFAVFLSASLLGPKKSAYAIGIYIISGMTGLPVFTGFRGGLSVLLSPTGGFIAGFFMIPLFVKIFSFAIRNKTVSVIAGEAVGLIFCYLSGAFVFSYMTGDLSFSSFISSMMISVVPFIIPDILKLFLAVVLSRKLEKAI